MLFVFGVNGEVKGSDVKRNDMEDFVLKNGSRME